MDSQAFNLDSHRFSTIRLILGDQLNADHAWFKTKSESTLYIIAELHQEQRYVRHHVQKICAFFKAMENFAQALRSAGHHVLHLTLDDTIEFPDLSSLLIYLCTKTKCQQFEYQRPDEYRLSQQFEAIRCLLQDLSIHVRHYETEHFALPFDEIPNYFKKNKSVRMEHFYRKMRKRFTVLMEGDTPSGGKWNYDEANRETFTQATLAEIPAPLVFSNDVSRILSRIKHHEIDCFGKSEESLLWPCSRLQARALCEFFCQFCLPKFGRFQDAMSDESQHAWSLYHSRLSFALNSKMLHPLDVIDMAIASFHASNGDITLPQIEGFVRQILGWREYVRGMYWINMPESKEQNALSAQRPLPTWFWNGETKMNCLHKAITQSLEYAYAHHIQRLMLIGNFALLSGLHPDEVDAWYLGIYIDAIEWVELPNTRGMALFSDGGLIASKPYAASGNYIHKMSDHCRTCHYKVKLKTGARACPFNSLYWAFLNQHKDTFEANPRLAFPYKAWAKMPVPQQTALLEQADIYLKDLNSL